MAHILPNHKKGDTFQGEVFHMYDIVDGERVAMDLTDVLIRMDVRASATTGIVMRFTNYPTNDPEYPGGGLAITDALGGIWEISRQIIDLPPKTYVYDIEFTFPGEDPLNILTLIEGTWTFVQDVTHD